MEISEDRLELCLEFLHSCLIVEGAQEAISDAKYSAMLEEKLGEKPLKEHVQDMINVGDSLHEDYIEILTNIRIYLLGS